MKISPLDSRTSSFRSPWDQKFKMADDTAKIIVNDSHASSDLVTQSAESSDCRNSQEVQLVLELKAVAGVQQQHEGGAEIPQLDGEAKVQGVPQYFGHFVLCNFSASRDPPIKILDNF